MSGMRTVEVAFPGGQRTIRVDDAGEASLADLLRDAGMALNTRCGQQGVCDGCRVRLRSGTLRGVDDQRRTGPSDEWIRACRWKADEGAIAIEVPQRSLLAHRPEALTDFTIEVPFGSDPIGGNADGLGLAIDLGTTTVAALLVELSTGRILARGSDFNQQMQYGDDVVTRISLCATDPAMLGRLQHAVAVETIAPLIDGLLGEAGRRADELACATVAGNTTMLHILAGVDPAPLGVVPFKPAFTGQRTLEAGTIDRWPERLKLTLHLLPVASAYIGADLTAGCLATGLAYDPGPSLLVDVGTNGEIILKQGGRMLGCATAAGPAFEGAGLSGGMRAAAGAISHLRIAGAPGRLAYDVIGGAGQGALGLCGSAYVDLLGEFRREKWLSPSGRFTDRLAGERIRTRDGCAVHLCNGPGDGPVCITEGDVARLLTAKAAIAAGIETLLAHAGLDARQVRRLYLAGGFGTHLNAGSAIGCGLLPGFAEAQIESVGNSALAGAYVSLCDCQCLVEIARLSQQIEIVELNLDPGFESRYIDHLSLPS